MEYDFLHWLGHASFKIKSEGIVAYIDPFRLKGKMEHADIVFITHPHFDHLHEESIGLIADGKTHFVSPADKEGKLRGRNVTIVRPGDSGEVLGIKFEAVHAYNTHPDKLNFHPKGNSWVGYIITVNGKRIYHPGDTDFIAEMRGIDVDLALLPCGGKYVMDIDDAIKASKVIRAKHFAPMHYKAILGKDGSDALEKRFAEQIKNAILLKDEGEPAYSF
ncbi:MAG: MBL fold metallo-hydrolase [Candidatus Micrarchaeota archaeon]|nr:MBL fold metallo-hydrolase [Candidatus Micrarchaeota archaeon]MDE1805007.1 MBL fold metallo-hydrolase [Candidatus Micrarchaeota archaeon]MDE1847223.1 MBL fold metallo-hydrolase [Candidatus Micrarchaeota archaeon]